MELNKKKCNKCLIIIPKASFNKDKSKADGFHTTCRLCEKECKKKYIDSKKEIMESITELQCKTCNLVKKKNLEFCKTFIYEGWICQLL